MLIRSLCPLFLGAALVCGVASAQTPAPAPAAAAPAATAAPAAAPAASAAAAPDPEFPPQPPIQPLSAADEAKTFQLPPGYKMELVLSEPDIKEPTICVFDGDGRMFVVEMRTYMQEIDGLDEFAPTSRVSLHWSSKKDGVFDKHTVFADNLVLPRIIQPLDKGRVIIGETNTSDLYLYTDTDGDGVADKKELWFQGGARGGNLEHQPNGLLWAQDNWLYSTYNAYRLRWTPTGPVKEATAANNGQWGLAQDNFGKIFFMNAGGEKGPQSFQVPTVYGQFNPPAQVEKGYEEVFPLPMHADVQGGPSRRRPEDGTLNHFTATAGAEIYRGDRLPAELYGNLFFGEPVGRLVRRSIVSDKDGMMTLSNPYQAERSEFIRSSDQLFRPVNFMNGPDGTLYIVDMYRGIIQEGNWVREGSYLRKVVRQYSFDKAVSHGRVWRLVHESTKRGPEPAMEEETPAQLVRHLEHPNGWWRDTAQRLLILKQDKSVVPALTEMARTNKNPLSRLHALWTLEGLDAADAALVTEKLKDENPQLRLAAIRVSESLIKKGDTTLQPAIEAMIADKDPGVSLQSVLTAKLLNWPNAKSSVEKLASTATGAPEGVRVIADSILHPPATVNVAKLTPAEKKSFTAGQEIFQTLCATCHGVDGRGLPMVGGLPGMRLAPSLAGSKTVNGPRETAILVLLHGLIGEIDGQKYEGQMISMATNDDAWIANVLSYARNAFGNKGGFIMPTQVAQLRASMASRTQPWTYAELKAAVPQPLPDRNQWKLTASQNPQKIANAVDGNAETRWDTGAAQKPGMWFQVELPEPKEITAVRLEFNNSSNDYPREYEVRLSDDGQTWGEPVAKGVGTPSVTDIEFEPVKAKFVRIAQNGTAPGTYWSIHELQLLAPTNAKNVIAKAEQAEAVKVVAAQTASPETVAPSAAPVPGKFALKPGDHIAIIGNALPDRMQHSGWLETLIYKSFPQHDLVVRNLAVAGDEVETRARSENFGTPDEWLQKTAADVIFAFFGFNESFAGYEGIEKFKQDLDKFLKETAAKNYSPKGAPRMVLFSPIAEEKLSDPNITSAQQNTNLRNYADAMAQVAKANNVQFVDLFGPSQKLFASAKQPLTIDGVHLTSEGDKALAPIIYEAVFGGKAPALDAASAKLRMAILDRNEMWHSRYRTVDGFNVYGGRSALAYAPGVGKFITDREAKAPYVSNYEVMQQEMGVRDVMTANRDKKVWAAAKGREVVVDDSNVPPVEKVGTNKPGDLPDGSHTYLSGEAAIAKMVVPKGCKVNLFASEEQFPELINPVQMAWDTKGRLWVSAWRNYPERTPSDVIGDSILIFEDTDGDGKADKCTHFIDNLNCPTGFQFYKDGILLMQAPNLWYVRDTNGDGKADTMERVLMGLDSADSHHTTNAMVLDPGGAVYLSDGVFHRTQVETTQGAVRNIDAAIYRYEPRTQKFETYVSYGFANPHGRVFDYWGNDIISDATGNANYFAPAFSGHIDYPQKHPTMKQFWERPSRPTPGTGILSSRHFPEEFQNNFLNCNVISLQAIFRVDVTAAGSGLEGKTLEHLVISDDPNFRPSAVNVGPDGAVYFADWSNAIIGHMQHHLRDPNRDHQHGRIYRITYEGRPLLKPAKIAGEPIENLLELLKTPEDDVRTLAKIELGARDSAQVIAAVNKWAASLDKNDPAYEHNMLEALWVHQWHNVVDANLLERMLKSPEPRARAAAARVLCYWRDRVPSALAIFKTLAADESPRVRLEAVRAASFFTGADVKPATEIVYEAIKRDADYYIEYCALESLKQLQPAGQEMVLPQDPKSLTWLLDRMDNTRLTQAPAVEPILLARLERKGIDAVARDAALTELAKKHNTDRPTEAIAVLRQLDAKGGEAKSAIDDLAKLLLMSATPADLAKVRPAFTELTTKAAQEPTRRAAWAAIAAADAKAETTWAAASDDKSRQALLDALILVVDPALRAQFQPILAALLADTNTSAGLRGAALRALPLMGPPNAAANFALLSTSLVEGRDRTDAARAIMQLPRDTWSKDKAAPIADAILAWAKTVPADKRTEQNFIETVQTGIEMASLLPPENASRVRKELRSLSVSVFVVKTVREGMRYDTPRLVVEPGKSFEIILENVDAMPHNLVVVKPGTREQVGAQAGTMSPIPDKQGRAYIPKNDNIIAATKLLEPGQKERIKIKAPDAPGEYEYVCTFPGHWPVMFGKLIITKDVDAALQASLTPAPAAPAEHQHAAQ